MSGAGHWDTVYSTQKSTDVSWWESEPSVSLHLISSVSDPTQSVVDIGAGSANLADHLIARGWRDVSVLDISSHALNNVRERFAGRDRQPHFLVADVTQWIPERTWDLWHDRAVFHFMTSNEMRDGYKRALERAVAPRGHAVIGTFAHDGPEQCSGIAVARYSSAALADQFAGSFEMISTHHHVHRTPWGAEQPFVWVTLARRP